MPSAAGNGVLNMIFIAILAGILVAPVALIMALPVFLPAIIWLLIWVAKLAGIIFAIWLVEKISMSFLKTIRFIRTES